MLTPRLVVCDLDYTLWWRPRFKAGPPWTPIDDGRNGVKSSCGTTLDLYDGARNALLRMADEGIPIALASRTHRPAWALEWLKLLKTDESRTVWDVVHPSPIIIRDGSKVQHIREIGRQADVQYSDMLYFDDSYADVVQVEKLGVVAVHCPAGDGLTDPLFTEGLARFASGAPRPSPPEQPGYRNGRTRGLRAQRRKRGRRGG